MSPLWFAPPPKGIPLAFRWPVRFCTTVTAATYILSVITGNCSQVDRVWTFLPLIYTAYSALLPLWPYRESGWVFPYVPIEMSGDAAAERLQPRALLMFGVQFIWMFRLSYNTWRRGLFSLKDEDYRWEIVRQNVPKWFFQIVNFVFIAVIQNIILFLLGVPANVVANHRQTPLGASDYILTFLSLAAVAMEFVADNQQFSFQTFKRKGVIDPNEWPGARIQWTPADAQRGFVTRGLWAWSRHPNFFCEQFFWFLQCLYPVFSSTRPITDRHHINTMIPSIVLTSLFFSSTLFTESITLSKYPLPYAAYQKRVNMFVPLLTPLHGMWLQFRGTKEPIDELVYGKSLLLKDVKQD